MYNRLNVGIDVDVALPEEKVWFDGKIIRRMLYVVKVKSSSWSGSIHEIFVMILYDT